MKPILIASGIIVILILLYVTCVWNRGFYEDYMTGFWTASGDKFCEDTEIDSMMLYLGEPTGWFNYTRECHLIITTDICNCGLKFNYMPGFNLPVVGIYRVSASVVFDEESEDQPFPAEVYIDMDPTAGVLRIHYDDVTYARLTKQHLTA